MTQRADLCHWKDIPCEMEFDCDECKYQPAPEDKPNGKADPVPLDWEPFLDYCSGETTGELPICSSCGEVPYDTERCFFCGQRFIQDEKVKEWNTPDPVEIPCFKCGGTMKGTRSKLNGHIHVACEACGTVIIE